jgi:hypothetical protein
MDNDTTTASKGAGDVSGTLSSSHDAANTPAPAPDENSLVGLTAPDYVFSLPSWTARDYAAFITGSGAAKLADSGVPRSSPPPAAIRGWTKTTTPPKPRSCTSQPAAARKASLPA